MSVTLKEIAHRTGVSQMTISRALRGIGSVKVATRKRVLQVAEEMGHFRSKGVVFPPPVRQGHTDHHLKLLLPYSRGNLLLPEFDQRFLTGLKQRLDETGGILHSAPLRSLDDIFREAHRHHVHGIVLRQILPADCLEKLTSNFPVVYAATDDFQAGVDSVSTNESRCAAQILDHLTLQGHRDIAFYGIADTQSALPSREESVGTIAFVDSSIGGARYAAWTYLAQTCSHPLPVQVDRRDPRFQSLDDIARLGLPQLLITRPQPTALVVATDSIAAAVVRGLREYGLRVPDDMSVISYGGTNQGRRQDPPLTSLRLPLEQIGHTVPELIERRLAQPSAVPVAVLLEATLLEGGTVAPPQRQL